MWSEHSQTRCMLTFVLVVICALGIGCSSSQRVAVASTKPLTVDSAQPIYVFAPVVVRKTLYDEVELDESAIRTERLESRIRDAVVEALARRSVRTLHEGPGGPLVLSKEAASSLFRTRYDDSAIPFLRQLAATTGSSPAFLVRLEFLLGSKEHMDLWTGDWSPEMSRTVISAKIVNTRDAKDIWLNSVQLRGVPDAESKDIDKAMKLLLANLK